MCQIYYNSFIFNVARKTLTTANHCTKNVEMCYKMCLNRNKEYWLWGNENALHWLETLLQQVNVILDFIYCEIKKNFEWNVEPI